MGFISFQVCYMHGEIMLWEGQDAHQFGGNIPVATEAYLKDLCVE